MKTKQIEYDGILYDLIIGENAKDNWNIIDISNENDIWFHVSEYPSAHVILNINNIKLKDVPKYIITQCGLICKKRSKVSDLYKIQIVYSELKNIKKDKTVGSVIVSKENYIRI